jgi:hypothetical protein
LELQIVLNVQRLAKTSFSAEMILGDRRPVCSLRRFFEVATDSQIRQFHVLGELAKPQTWNSISMKQAFSRSTPTPRESFGARPQGREKPELIVNCKV